MTAYCPDQKTGSSATPGLGALYSQLEMKIEVVESNTFLKLCIIRIEAPVAPGFYSFIFVFVCLFVFCISLSAMDDALLLNKLLVIREQVSF